MEPNRQQPFLLPDAPRYFAVRCSCGRMLVLDAIKGSPEFARCARLDRPAWIECDGCLHIKQYFSRDVVKLAASDEY